MTAPEPLTLAELVRHLGEYDYWLGYDPSGMYVAMPMDNDSPVRCGTGSTPWEAANDAMPKRKVAPRDEEAAELRQALEDVWRWLKSEFAEPDPTTGEAVEAAAREIWETVCAVLAASEGQP